MSNVITCPHKRTQVESDGWRRCTKCLAALAKIFQPKERHAGDSCAFGCKCEKHYQPDSSDDAEPA